MTGRRTACRCWIAFLLLVLLPACYSYVPLESGEPRVGEDVRLHLVEPEEGASASPVGTTDERTLTGLVVYSRADSLTLSRSAASARNVEVGSAALRDTLTLSRSSIRRIEHSRIDAARTAIMTGLGAGAIAAAVYLVANSTLDDSSAGGGSGGTPRNSVTVPVRIPLDIP